MSQKHIQTSDTRSGETADPVTGTNLPGEKRGMDVSLPSHDPYIDLVHLVLIGNQPEENYDSVERIEVSSTQVNYIFKSGSSTQFTISVTGIDTAFPIASILGAGIDNLLLESGDNLLLESGDLLLPES